MPEICHVNLTEFSDLTLFRKNMKGKKWQQVQNDHRIQLQTKFHKLTYYNICRNVLIRSRPSPENQNPKCPTRPAMQKCISDSTSECIQPCAISISNIIFKTACYSKPFQSP